MDFELTDEQRGLVDSTRSLLGHLDSVSRARALIDDNAGFDHGLWTRGSQLGWPAVAIAEADGGLGLQTIELALIAEELGRGLAATPFIPVAVVADALGGTASDRRAELLQSISTGELITSWAFAERGRPWDSTGITAYAKPDHDGFQLHGAKVSVPDADGAQLLLVDALLDGEPARFLVPTDARGVGITRQHTLDVTRRYCDISLDGVPVDAAALLTSGQTARRSLDRSLQLHTVLVCAELVGIGQRLLAMTVDYVKERVQFGRPVGSFQAVKHKCADMRIWVQASTAATYHAAMALDGAEQEADHAVSVAKAYVSDAINQVAGHALQLHAGIGFTWEHDLHLYLRRARANALIAGDATYHRERLCQALHARPA